MSVSEQFEPSFDLVTLSRAIEARDADMQIPMYADDAVVQVIDPHNPPGSPRVLRGRVAIASWIDDICGLRMTHRVVTRVDGGDTVAFTEEGRYADGTKVVSVSTLEIREGLVVRQRVVSVWDDLDWH